MIEDIQRQRTVFPSTSGPNMFDVAGPATGVQSLEQGRLPSFNEGRAGRGNYQGDSVFPAPFDTTVNEIPMGNRYPGSHTFYDMDKPYRQEAGLREQPPQGITSLPNQSIGDTLDHWMNLFSSDTQSSLRGGFDRGQRITEGLSVVADVEDDNAAVMKLDALGFDMEAIEEIMSQRDLEQTAKVYNMGDPEMINEGFFWDSLSPGAEGINSILSNPVFNQMIEAGFGSEQLYEAIPDYLKDTIPSEAFRNMHDWKNQQPLDLKNRFLYEEPEQDIGAG